MRNEWSSGRYPGLTSGGCGIDPHRNPNSAGMRSVDSFGILEFDARPRHTDSRHLPSSGEASLRSTGVRNHQLPLEVTIFYARHVGRNRGHTHFRPLPTPHHGTNESKESTGFDRRRHRPVKDPQVLRPAALGWCGRTQAWPTTSGGARQALRGALRQKKQSQLFE